MSLLEEDGASDLVELARGHAAVADVLYQKHELEAAKREYVSAIELRSQSSRYRDDQSQSVLEQARDWRALGRIYLALDRTDEAVKCFRSSLECTRRVSSDGHPRTATALSWLAYGLRNAGTFGEVEDLYLEALAIRRKARGNHSRIVVNTLLDLGAFYLEINDHRRAAETYEEVVRIQEVLSKDKPENLVTDLNRLATAYRLAGRTADAIQVEGRVNMIRRQQRLKLARDFFGANYLGVPVWCLLVLGIPGVMIALFWTDYRLTKRFQSPCHPVAEAEANQDQGEGRTFGYYGAGSELFGLWAGNVLWTILTFGIYYFWGKTRIRRYVWAHTEFHGDRLAWHGTPTELLAGWLKVSPFLLVIFVAPDLLPILWRWEYAQECGIVLAMATLLVVWPVAQVGVHCYRLARTSWRAVRFSFRGSSARYVGLWTVGWLLSIMTAGLWFPFMAARCRRALLEGACFGDRYFAFHARGRDLLAAWVLTVVLMPLTFGCSWFWYRAYRERYFWSRTKFQRAHFECTLTGGRLFRLITGNWLLTIATLGLARPWVVTRTAQVWLENLRIAGDVDFTAIRQEERAVGAGGEGAADFVGLDFGI